MKKGLFEQKRERNDKEYLKCKTKEEKGFPIPWEGDKDAILDGKEP
jgi:hypothetical protein